ncbi:MAG TPA: L-ribulose-5-phosphate 4-epimerase [Anaerolineaceae bacterium]|jgi:L-ribulose-5-phosphate 4-epimerase|nr:L-ribulose-5-phosphate 4-epimerase [Anaerolineaceae bacterium]
MLEALKKEMVELLKELPQNGLVCLTSGNVSARDAKTGLVMIKPSGVPYEQLDESKLVVLNLDGKVVEGSYKPSSDTASHLYIYQNRQDVNGIVHTHSAYATVFAALGKNIPVLTTETAEEFGGEIPCAEFVLIGDDEIGKQVVLYGERCNAVLLKKHGVFTFAATPRRAVDLAILTENSARIAWLILQMGEPDGIGAEEIKALYYRQQNIYGQ